MPGGEVSVGYDGGRFQPTPQQAASYLESADEYGLALDIGQFVDSQTLPRRTSTVPSLLVAVEAIEAGAVAVPRDPEIVELVANLRQSPIAAVHGQPRQIEWSGQARARLDPDGGTAVAWRLGVPTYAAEIERLAAIGQRLLTVRRRRRRRGLRRLR